jgi:ABC-2 type transport system ATP-binding protein
MIQLEHVSFRYGRAPVLEDVSLSAEEGSSLGLIGPNGSGKSTLLKLVATLLRPRDGRVLVGGFDTRFDAPSVRRRIGYVPEQLGVYPNLTIWQYLAFFARSAGLSSVDRKTTIETLLQVVDLQEQREVQVQQLSRGMRRRLALARAVLHNPVVLLLDDPLGGLDGRGRLEVLEVLKELRGMGITVLMSGHLLGDIVQLCSEVAVVRDGRVTRTVSVDEFAGQSLAAAQRVEIEILLGLEMARDAVASLPQVSDLVVSGRTVSFAYKGDEVGLSTLLDGLLRDGVQVTRFGPAADRFDRLAAGLVEANGKVPA